MNLGSIAQTDRLFGFRIVDRQWLIAESTLDTQGNFLVIQQKLEPHAVGLPKYYHPRAETYYKILTGRLSLWRDEQWQLFAAGQTITLTADVAHSLKNEQMEPVEFRGMHRPALGYECFLTRLYGLIRRGGLPLPPKGVRNWLQLSMLMHERDIQLVRPSNKFTRWLALEGYRLLTDKTNR